MSAPAPFVLVVSLQPLDAMTTLFFGHLVGQVPEATQVVRHGDPQLAAALADTERVFQRSALHDRLMLFPPIQWRQRLSRPMPRREGVCVAFFGGLHLHDVFIRCVLPAVRRLASEQPVTLIAAGVHEPIVPPHGLTVIKQPYDQSYARGLQRLAEAGVDVLLCDDSVESWYAALAQTMRPDQRRPIQERLFAFCATHFSRSVNRPVVDEVLRLHAPPNTRWMWTRRGVVRACLLLGRLRQGGARVMRRLRLSAGSSGP